MTHKLTDKEIKGLGFDSYQTLLAEYTDTLTALSETLRVAEKAKKGTVRIQKEIDKAQNVIEYLIETYCGLPSKPAAVKVVADDDAIVVHVRTAYRDLERNIFTSPAEVIEVPVIEVPAPEVVIEVPALDEDLFDLSFGVYEADVPAEENFIYEENIPVVKAVKVAKEPKAVKVFKAPQPVLVFKADKGNEASTNNFEENMNQTIPVKEPLVEAEEDLFDLSFGVYEADAPAEAPAKVIEAPAPAEAPVKVIEAPAPAKAPGKFIKAPAPAKVIEAPAKVIEVPAEVIEVPSPDEDLFDLSFGVYEAEASCDTSDDKYEAMTDKKRDAIVGNLEPAKPKAKKRQWDGKSKAERHPKDDVNKDMFEERETDGEMTDKERAEKNVPLFKIMSYLRQALCNAGYHTENSPTGNFCGLNIYREEVLSVEGIKHPTSRTITIKRRLEVTDAVCEELLEVLQNRMPASNEKQYMALVSTMLTLPSDATTLAYKMVASREPSEPGKTALSGGGIRFCPTSQTVTQNLSDTEMLSLLAILPEDEARSLILALGRVLVGEDGSKTHEGLSIEHTFRNLLLIVGADAGLGKSTLMLKFLIPTLKKLGYSVESAPQGLSDKGWIEPAMSCLTFVDDLSPRSQSSWFDSSASAVIKTLVSNGSISLDAKYKNFRMVKARTVIIGCSNGYDIKDSMSADSGVLNRLHALATRPVTEVFRPKDNLDLRTLTVWQNMSKAKGISITELSVGFLAKCADNFLSVIGYSQDTAGKFRKTHDSNLMEYSDSLREKYKLKVTMTHARSFTESMAMFYAKLRIEQAVDYNREKLSAQLETSEFSADIMLAYINFVSSLSVKAGTEFFKGSECLRANEVNWLTTASNFAAVNSNETVHKTTSECVAEYARLLESTSGYGFPTKPSYYVSVWESCISAARHSLEELESLKLTPQASAVLSKAVKKAI